jgi:DNA-binding GntR family transcriptional regulator
MKMNENPLDIKSLPEQLFFRIKQKILSGEIKGGSKIAEEKLAADFGVSRTPIREALRRLDEYGLIAIRPRRFAEVLQMTHEEVAHLTAVRIALERLAVELFIRKALKDDITALGEAAEACRKCESETDVGGFYEKDSYFHLEIAGRSGNPFLYGALEKLDAKVQLSRLVKPLNPQNIKAAMDEHEEILYLIETRDAALAAEKMEIHISNNL